MDFKEYLDIVESDLEKLKTYFPEYSDIIDQNIANNRTWYHNNFPEYITKHIQQMGISSFSYHFFLISVIMKLSHECSQILVHQYPECREWSQEKRDNTFKPILANKMSKILNIPEEELLKTYGYIEE